jgi:hypothetical protein
MENALAGLDSRRGFLEFCDEARGVLSAAGISTPLSQWYLEPAQPSRRLCDVVLDDDFDRLELRAEWQWHDPIRASRYSLSDRPGSLTLSASLRSNLWPETNLNAPRVLLEVRGDFALETRMQGNWVEPGGCGGLLIWKDVLNFIRLDKMPLSRWHLGDLVLEARVDGAFSCFGRGRLPGDSHTLRLERTGERIMALCGTDGVNWFTCGQLVFPVGDPLLVGVHTTNGRIAHFDHVRVMGSASS